jgi:TRAP-type mannitol/chloroaromatic compound transport system permease small subunit
MKKVFRVIDAISDHTGNIVQWLCVPLVLIISYETIMRYIFSISTLWEYETVAMMGATLYGLSFAYVMRHRLNVRVDVLFSHFSRRVQAFVDSVGMLIAFIPVMTLVVITSIQTAIRAFDIDERMAITGWYPPAAPLRTVLAAAFILLLLQGLVVTIREFYYLLRNKSYD